MTILKQFSKQNSLKQIKNIDGIDVDGRNKKNFEDKELPHELFVTARQTAKIRNTLANNMSTYIKLSKDQISKIIQSGGSFGIYLYI